MHTFATGPYRKLSNFGEFNKITSNVAVKSTIDFTLDYQVYQNVLF